MIKNPTLIILFLFILQQSIAQKNPDVFTAINGITYHIGDSVTLGVGSASDGKFNHIYYGAGNTLLQLFSGDVEIDFRLKAEYAGKKIVIKKFKVYQDQVYGVSSIDDFANFAIEINKAIGECEIAFCRPGGYLTQEEFEKLILIYQSYQDGKIDLPKFQTLRRELITAPPEEIEEEVK